MIFNLDNFVLNFSFAPTKKIELRKKVLGLRWRSFKMFLRIFRLKKYCLTLRPKIF